MGDHDHDHPVLSYDAEACLVCFKIKKEYLKNLKEILTVSFVWVNKHQVTRGVSVVVVGCCSKSSDLVKLL